MNRLGFAVTVAVPSGANADVVHDLINSRFQHVPEFAAALDANQAEQNTDHPSNSWVLLSPETRGQGDRNGTILKPFTSHTRVDYWLLMRYA